MTVLAIGGNGFIGSHVVDALLANGHSVAVFGRSPEQFRKPLENVTYFTANLSDKEMLRKALEGVSTVIHMVSTTVPSTSNLDPVADITGNLIATVELLKLIRSSSVKRIVFLSSGGTVYGIPTSLPIPETQRRRPISSYGIVKSAIENYLMMEHALHGLDYVILRPSNPYGPRQGLSGVQGLIGTFLWRIARQEPLSIWGDGGVVRDYVHVRDLALACVAAVERGGPGIFNVGAGKGHSVKDVLDIVRQVTGSDPLIKRQPARGFDVPEVVLDCAAGNKALDWRARIELTEGIGETWEWVLSKGQPVVGENPRAWGN
jgi:UDP-glucose 4-epimerase